MDVFAVPQVDPRVVDAALAAPEDQVSAGGFIKGDALPHAGLRASGARKLYAKSVPVNISGESGAVETGRSGAAIDVAGTQKAVGLIHEGLNLLRPDSSRIERGNVHEGFTRAKVRGERRCAGAGS